MEKILLQNIKEGNSRITIQVIPSDLKQIKLTAIESGNTIKDICTDAVVDFIINHDNYDINGMRVNKVSKDGKFKTISPEIDATIHHMFKQSCSKFKNINMKDIFYDIIMTNIYKINNKMQKNNK